MEWYRRNFLKEFQKSYFKNGSIYYLWGYPYRLMIRWDGNYISIENQNLVFSTLSKNTIEENRDILLSWYKDTLTIEINKVKKEIEKLVGQKANTYYVEKMKGYNTWGTCTIKEKKIKVDRRLVLFNKEMLEQILIHELLHLIIPGHNKEFYALEKKYCPNLYPIRWCLAHKNPDYRYYNFYKEEKEKGFEYSYEDYCKVKNINKEIL